MNLSSYIAGRYFFSKSSRNAVNIISGISIFGILVGTAALIIVLSAFNGLERLVTGFYDAFDPDLKVESTRGKYWDPTEQQLQEIRDLEGVTGVSLVLEEKVLLTYREKEYIATLKGVDDNYRQVNAVDEAVTHGEYLPKEPGPVPSAVLGAGVTYFLGYGRISFEEPINVFIPKAGASAADFSNAFSSEVLYPRGVFSIQPEFDKKYVISRLSFVRDLLNRPQAVSALEVKISEANSVQRVEDEIQKILGADFSIKDREEQQAVFMKVMKTESLFTFLVFALILFIASFTIMGSLSMMMLDKKQHLRTLWAMGAELRTLRHVFFKEGMLISFIGAAFGLALGVGLVFFQQQFGMIRLGQGYVVESYPVELRLRDVLLVLTTVAILGGSTSWLTSRRLSLKLLRT